MVIWSYLAQSRVGLRSRFWEDRHNVRVHIGHEPVIIAAHEFELVIGLQIPPVSRFDIL